MTGPGRAMPPPTRQTGNQPPANGGRACACEPRFEEPPSTDGDNRVALVVDADECAGGDLATDPACLATVVDALAERDATVVRVRSRGMRRTYAGDAAGLLLAAGRFVDMAEPHDPALAGLARVDPFAAGREAAGRAGPVRDLAVETGLAEGAARFDDLESALRPTVGPTISGSCVDLEPPGDARLADRRELSTGAIVRLYDCRPSSDSSGVADTDDDAPRTARVYHLQPVETGFDAAEYGTLADAGGVLARGQVGDGERAPDRAVRRVADDGVAVERLAAVLRKHTGGVGVLDDLFADPRVSDVFVTAPVSDNPVRVTVDGDEVPTNVRFTPEGVAALASTVRRESGRGFSRASPRIDATVATSTGERVRVAGVRPPLGHGIGFAFRRAGDDAWTLPRLVGNGTLTAGAAALLSLAVERGAALLVTGGRGAGKTTMLEALVREIPPGVRTVVVEDTPELPVADLQGEDRDVQALRTEPDVGGGDGERRRERPGVSAATALRTALRLGEGALVVGEVRGTEARVLYEAMRVGAAADAVLGTVHGTDAAAVRERVVGDLGVPASSFGATDLVVTVAADDRHRLHQVEEVRRTGEGTTIAPLFSRGSDGLAPTGIVDRGDSVLVAGLARPDETYTDVRDALEERAGEFRRLADAGVFEPRDIQRVRG